MAKLYTIVFINYFDTI